ncbi:Receptor-like protein 5 [Arabidopsis thaliana]|uniref:Uncharacterized protein n=1 Tax=Arabidopsis thaliana x Arabidopsis arenosa TaxID=1240361 RepID=A0A8T2GMF9_9BRAS|nr:hypothetical protein ISN45_At01g034060 [Arabidopsis thaliana x Arabidopsis arenosa]
MINYRHMVFCLCVMVVVDSRLTPYLAAIEQVDPIVKIVLPIVGRFDPEEFVTSWQGNNPCEWFGTNCLEGIIIGISFISLNLIGTISPHFADLTSLRVIDLSHNRLKCTILFEITKLKNLTIVDVSYNQLHGEIPRVRGIVILTERNPNIESTCLLVPSPTRNKNKPTVLVLLLGILVGLVVAGGASYLFRIRKQPKRLQEPNEAVTLTQQQSSDESLVSDESYVISLQLQYRVLRRFSWVSKGPLLLTRQLKTNQNPHLPYM